MQQSQKKSQKSKVKVKSPAGGSSNGGLPMEASQWIAVRQTLVAEFALICCIIFEAVFLIIGDDFPPQAIGK